MSRKGAGRKHPSSAQLLLTGVPGAGKTTLGNHLHEKHRFRHLDFETGTTMSTFLGQGDEAHIRTRINRLKKDGRDVVITWGFVPDHLRFAMLLQRLGFTWVWLDGNREASHRAFSQRGSVEERFYAAQMQKIETMIDPVLDSLPLTVVNPFNGSGEFLLAEEIVGKLPLKPE